MFRAVARQALERRAQEDKRRIARLCREKAKEAAKEAGRKVSFLFCGMPTRLP
jgi:hypothetical protein